VASLLRYPIVSTFSATVLAPTLLKLLLEAGYRASSQVARDGWPGRRRLPRFYDMIVTGVETPSNDSLSSGWEE